VLVAEPAFAALLRTLVYHGKGRSCCLIHFDSLLRKRGARRRARTAYRFAVENLEDRRLFSASPIDQRVATFEFAAERHVADLADGVFDVGLVNDSRERRTVDAGDFYWADGQKMPLLRLDDEVAAGFADTVDRGALIATLLGADSRFAGYRESSLSTDQMAVLWGERAGTSGMNDLRATPGVSWTGPVFATPDGRSRLIATNELIVALRPGVSAQDFFDNRFAGFEFGAPGT
jgi:hypothetical protein